MNKIKEKKDINQIIVKVLIGISATALVGGFLLGIFNKSDDTNAKKNDSTNEVMNYENDVEREENDKIDSETNKTEEQENEDDPEEPHSENYDGFEMATEKLGKRDVIEKTPYKDFMGKKKASESRKFAEDFIKDFYNLDGDKPTHYIEKSKKYMSDDLFENIMGEPEMPSYDKFNRKLVSIETFESDELSKEDSEIYIPYFIRVKGETVNIDGKDKQELIDEYTIVLVITDDGYLVENVFKNIFHN